MEWIAPLLIGILGFSAFVQLLWAHSLSVIARKSDCGSLMEVLAWVPLLQIAPMLAVGGGSLGPFLLGSIGLVVANIAFFAGAAVLGDGLGAALPVLGGLATMIVCFGYFGRILWNTATARDLPGWVGLLMFVPLANFFVYPIIAFHDGWAGPHKVGLLIGTLITVGSMAPYYTAFQLLEEAGGEEGWPANLAELQLHELEDIGALDDMEIEVVTNDPGAGPGGAAAAMPTEVARDHEKSIRALFELKGRFDQLESLTAPENMLIQDHRVRALSRIGQLRAELASQRADLDPKTYEELATHLIEIEARVHGRDSAGSRARFAGGPSAGAGSAGSAPAALGNGPDESAAPLRPFPVQASEGCPRNTELRNRTTDRGEEEWCQQLASYGGLRHGWYARYFEGGKPEQMGEYHNGLRVGVWTRFYPEGEVRAQAQFRDGMQHGWLLTFDRNGERQKAVRFEEGTALR